MGVVATVQPTGALNAAVDHIGPVARAVKRSAPLDWLVTENFPAERVS